MSVLSHVDYVYIYIYGVIYVYIYNGECLASRALWETGVYNALSLGLCGRLVYI